MKKYTAKTNVSINVVLRDGTNRHIAFSAQTGGGSVFYTADGDVQEAMERHYKYGTLFRVDRGFVQDKAAGVGADDQRLLSEESELSEPSEIDEAGEQCGLKTIVVSDPDAAKAYLAEHFGISRTKLKRIEMIKETAAANGIEFEGL